MKLQLPSILSALVLIAGCGVQSRALRMPDFLQEGDKVALISPASRIEIELVDSIAMAIEQWGLVPVYGVHVSDSLNTFAGSEAARRQDLLWALKDPEIKAIMCTRGGYGSVHILCNLPLKILRKYPKWISGYSDITALLSAEICAGNMGIHSNMGLRPAMGEETDSIGLMLKRILYGELPTYHSAPHELDNCGSAEGILIGGNLSVFSGLAGSDYDFFKALRNKDIILFIEDINENCRKVDRMLHQMIVRGVMKNVKGIIVGRFVDCEASNGFDDIYQMLHYYLKDLDIPIAYDFPVGHDESYNYPLIEGCRVLFSVSPEGSTLRFLRK